MSVCGHDVREIGESYIGGASDEVRRSINCVETQDVVAADVPGSGEMDVKRRFDCSRVKFVDGFLIDSRQDDGGTIPLSDIVMVPCAHSVKDLAPAEDCVINEMLKVQKKLAEDKSEYFSVKSNREVIGERMNANGMFGLKASLRRHGSEYSVGILQINGPFHNGPTLNLAYQSHPYGPRMRTGQTRQASQMDSG